MHPAHVSLPPEPRLPDDIGRSAPRFGPPALMQAGVPHAPRPISRGMHALPYWHSTPAHVTPRGPCRACPSLTAAPEAPLSSSDAIAGRTGRRFPPPCALSAPFRPSAGSVAFRFGSISQLSLCGHTSPGSELCVVGGACSIVRIGVGPRSGHGQHLLGPEPEVTTDSPQHRAPPLALPVASEGGFERTLTFCELMGALPLVADPAAAAVAMGRRSIESARQPGFRCPTWPRPARAMRACADVASVCGTPPRAAAGRESARDWIRPSPLRRAHSALVPLLARTLLPPPPGV